MSFTRTDSVASTVLVVENDPLMLTAIGSLMDMQGHRPMLARTEEVAMQAIAQNQFDAIVLSIEGLDAGCRFAAELRSTEATRDVPVVFLVPELDGTWSQRLAAHGGVFSLLKPVDPHALLELVEKVLWMPHVAKGRVAAPNLTQSSQTDWVKLT
jgi:DNA-binding response OmpR family regulator